jgi:hypothetical protein
MSVQAVVSVTVTSTGTVTAIIGGQAVLQTSNDSANWIPQATAIATATVSVASTGVVVATASSTAAAAFVFTGKYGYGRVVVSSTGSGNTKGYVAY